jgi:carbonic anhydrase
MVNVAVQLAKLEDHPVAGPALAAGKVQALGLFYDIATARVLRVTADGIEDLDPAFDAGLQGKAFANR